jgi:hypothetical protein
MKNYILELGSKEVMNHVVAAVLLLQESKIKTMKKRMNLSLYLSLEALPVSKVEWP